MPEIGYGERSALSEILARTIVVGLGFGAEAVIRSLTIVSVMNHLGP